jgi:hypothetical protein
MNAPSNKSMERSPPYLVHRKDQRQAGWIGEARAARFGKKAITKAFQQNTPVTAILNMSKHKSVETLMIYNKGLDNLENNAVHSLNYDSE